MAALVAQAEFGRVLAAKEGSPPRRREERMCGRWNVVVCRGGGEKEGQNRRDLKLPRAPTPTPTPFLSTSVVAIGGKIGVY